MTWKPSSLTREQLEERRLAGGRLLQAGKLSQAEIARQMGVSRATVGAWARALRALRKRKAQGGIAKLTKEQLHKLKRHLERGAVRCGFSTDRWTLERVAELIQREFGVSYHPNYLSRLLHRLGYSVQRPLPRAAEQERTLVQAWLDHDLPRIKKVAAAVRRNRVLG